MIKKDTILLISISLLILLSVAALFYRSIILQDFTLMTYPEEIE